MVDPNNSGGIVQKVFSFLRGFGANSSSSGGRLLYEGYIAGYQYHQGEKFEKQFEPGTDFSLKHEPENPFNENAVAVYYNDNRIGFIPTDWSHEVANKLKNGKNVKARVASFEPDAEPWQRLQVEVVYQPETK